MCNLIIKQNKFLTILLNKCTILLLFSYKKKNPAGNSAWSGINLLGKKKKRRGTTTWVWPESPEKKLSSVPVCRKKKIKPGPNLQKKSASPNAVQSRVLLFYEYEI